MWRERIGTTLLLVAVLLILASVTWLLVSCITVSVSTGAGHAGQQDNDKGIGINTAPPAKEKETSKP